MRNIARVAIRFRVSVATSANNFPREPQPLEKLLLLPRLFGRATMVPMSDPTCVVLHRFSRAARRVARRPSRTLPGPLVERPPAVPASPRRSIPLIRRRRRRRRRRRYSYTFVAFFSPLLVAGEDPSLLVVPTCGAQPRRRMPPDTSESQAPVV